jgi:hypothetical protein
LSIMFRPISKSMIHELDRKVSMLKVALELRYGEA